MAYCPTCGKEGYEAKETVRGEFDIPVTGLMKDNAFLFSKNAKCKPDWQKFLSDLQGRLYITEKQRKFYAVIHKELLGSWPPRETETAPKPEPTPIPDDQLPF